MNRRSLIALGLATALTRFFPLGDVTHGVATRAARDSGREVFRLEYPPEPAMNWTEGELWKLGPMQQALREAQAGWSR